jgi:hypothetical protein
MSFDEVNSASRAALFTSTFVLVALCLTSLAME